MNPIAMTLVFLVTLPLFAWSASRRWNLLRVGRDAARFDRIGERIDAVVVYALGQKKMGYYKVAGLAHKLIFFGFGVLLLRTLMLWGRAFVPGFSLFVLGVDGIPGQLYDFLKDVFATAVVAGAMTFVYYRVVKPQKRMTLHWEGLLILGIICTMMLSDMAYDGAADVLYGRTLGKGPEANDPAIAAVVAHLVGTVPHEGWSPFPSPAGSLFAVLFGGLGSGALFAIAHVGFIAHASLVLVFLNILPYSKHFHIITSLPNVFTTSLTPKGALPAMAENSEKLMEIVGAAAEKEDPLADPVGAARIEHFTWKAILDFYTCTECGRCSDNCPAHGTGKILSPKFLTLDLRDHLYGREKELVAQWSGKNGAPPKPEGGEAKAEGAETTEAKPAEASAYKPIDLIPNVIHPDVVWACTTCRACEEQCPVLISYVDKIVDLRRNLVLVKGEFPAELQKPFQGMETNGNPWNLARVDRAAWTEGLDIKTMAEHPTAEVLYWVGCAASYDDRAKKIARATARLLQAAGVDFAILGEEENCTGDSARRAGNEFLYLMLAESNVATINGYKEQGGIKKILTACPHCFNTIANEYPDLGGKYEVLHHSDFLLGLVAEKKLVPKEPVKGKVAFHDSCYLGRYNDIYESPREILRRIPGVELVEPTMTKNTGLCCGAGGAQMWMEEQNKNRMNVRRTLQLVETGAKTIATGCPFCQTMLTDGLKAEGLDAEIKQLDIAELLEQSCALPAPTAKVEAEAAAT